jgi:hypothetical protein
MSSRLVGETGRSKLTSIVAPGAFIIALVNSNSNGALLKRVVGKKFPGLEGA